MPQEGEDILRTGGEGIKALHLGSHPSPLFNPDLYILYDKNFNHVYSVFISHPSELLNLRGS